MKNIEMCDENLVPLRQLEEGLTTILGSAGYPMEKINDHLLCSSGKRIRPALFYLALGFWGEESAAHLPVALAIELIHTATLVHDDVVDCSVKRRGNQTINAVWGQQTAVLTGDYLFAEAFSLLAAYGNIDVLRKMAALVKEISEGEIQQQQECYRADISYADYYERISKKTARFFSACTSCAGLVSGADNESMAALSEYGFHLGMAFQIVDDLLDFLGSEEVTGKPVGEDLRQGILTLPVLHLLNISPYREEFTAKISRRQIDDQFIARITQELKASKCLEYVQAVAVGFVQQANKNVGRLPFHPNRETLRKLGNFIVDRRF
ncbi:MAG: polyprenyl synthetase family protein [Dethiobacter sp.]|nr:polyprenyl synthetase family protein [Dethiobacter sp.]MBS3990394.1 polyprenyl synthetase family protein [Dethiobacter sp.]